MVCVLTNLKVGSFQRYTLTNIKVETLVFKYIVKNNIKNVYLLLPDSLRGPVLLPDVLNVV